MNNETGFTMITSLLTIVIIAITLPLISFVFNQINSPELSDDIKYSQFFNFIHDDILRANNIYVNGHTLMFETRTDELATVSQYYNIIRRQVNGVGHEVYVRDVQDFSVKQNNHYIQLKLVSIEGDVYEKTIPTY